ARGKTDMRTPLAPWIGDESLRNLAAEDLSERLRIDVPSGDHADEPAFSGLPREGRGNRRTPRAFCHHAVPFDQQTDRRSDFLQRDDEGSFEHRPPDVPPFRE